MHSRKSSVMLFMDEGFCFYCCLVVVFVALLLFLCCTLKVIYIFELWIYSNILAINRSNISYLTVPYCGCVSSSSLESQVCDMRHATCLFFSSFCFIQVPNGHEEDELADGEVMNYMCRDDEVMKENLYSYNCLILILSFEQQQSAKRIF